jgi:hypothetical protein
VSVMNFSLTKTVAGAAHDWLRQMVKKHQPSNETCADSMLEVGAGGRYSPVLNCQNSRLASPVCEGRCTICVVIPAQPVIMARFRVSPQ